MKKYIRKIERRIGEMVIDFLLVGAFLFTVCYAILS